MDSSETYEDESTINMVEDAEEEGEEHDDSFTSNDILFMKLVFERIFFPIIIRVSNQSPSLICYDGEYAQIEATFQSMISLAEQAKIELMKLPAATTMLYQPNDLMRSHCLIHQYVHTAVSARKI